MAGGNGTGGPRGGTGDPRRRQGDFEGLRRLGEEVEPSRRARRTANEEGLTALGEALDSPPRRRRASSRVRRRRLLAAGLAVVLVLVAIFGGGWLYLRYRFSQIPKIDVAAEQAIVAGQPFNILVIGSDSRAGLSGSMAAQAGASVVQGQRSDVVMIWHVDPKSGQISILSIPRDTMVSTIPALRSQVGTFNRINTAYGSGPNDVVQTIESNFGIPINHVVQVSFTGFVGAVDALGGVWLNFPYPSRDAFSGLNVTQPGCQLLNGVQALGVARSRHFQYEVNGRWYDDGSSDFGRIHRQGAFLRALVHSAKSKYNPLTINAFLGAIPQGMSIDSKLGLSELLGLALRFHGIDPNSISTQTLPTTAVSGTQWGSVLFADQPAAQAMLVGMFGSQLTTPATPPPNTRLETPLPPSVTPTTAPATTTTHASAHSASTPSPVVAPTPAVTTTTQPSFDPTPCSA